MKTGIQIYLLGALALLSTLGAAHAQTVVWSDNFDDGNGNSRWYADEGVWQIGSPTYGPPTNGLGCRSHSCPSCAATGLNGPYPVGMNSRLIRIETFVVPAANQFPRVRFWQWYSFGNDGVGGYDYGQVEIKGSNNTWQVVSPRYVNFSGDWTYASVDLSAFAGQTVQLAFHAIYGGISETDPGWYIDDISLLVGTPTFENPEGFESGMGDWYAETGTWQVGSPTKSSGPATDSSGSQAHTGTNCAVTSLASGYPVGMNSRFVSPPLTLPPASSSPYLRFWHWYSFGNDGVGGDDRGIVEIRVSTNSWQSLSSSYTGSSGVWTEPYFDLSSFGGETVQIAFHAIYGGISETAPGWYIDDVQIFPYVISPGPANLLPAIPNTNIDELVLWQYTPAVSGSGYTFGLSNQPSGMAVDSSSGTISWTPTQPQATYTYSNINYIVYQSGLEVASTNFNVTVNDINVAPFLSVPGTIMTYATFPLTANAAATESDIWATSVSFALVSAPSGMNINAATGAITWTPTVAQVGTNAVYVSATDEDPHAVNAQFLSVTNSFAVIVQGVSAPTFTTGPVSEVINAGQSVTFTATASGYPAPTYQWQFDGTNISGATGTSYTIPSTALSNIGYYTLVASNSVKAVSSSSASLTFLNLHMYAGLEIFGPLGSNYIIQSTAALNSSNWTTLTNVSLLTQPYIYIDYSSPTNPYQFYRAIPQ